MGQICGSPIKGMGCSFMGVLFLSQCLRGSGLCNSSVHQGQAAIWERFSVLLPQTGMQIATALGRWCRESLPRFGICFSTTFLSYAFFPPLSFCISGCIFWFFFPSWSISLFLALLQGSSVQMFLFFVSFGAGGPLGWFFPGIARDGVWSASK